MQKTIAGIVIYGNREAYSWFIIKKVYNFGSLIDALAMHCLEDKYGAGCISVEKIMEEPTCRAIAAMLEGCEIVAPVLPVVQVAPVIHAKTFPATEHVVQSDANVDCVDGFHWFHSVDHHGWIRTTHVGSLPRPADGTLDLNQVIAQQADCVDIINDGEWGRENYIADVINRVSGLQSGLNTEPQTACCAKHAMPLASDMQDVPIYAQRFSGGNGLITLNPKRPAVSGLACVDHPKYTSGNMSNLQAFLTAVSAAGKPVSESWRGLFERRESVNIQSVLGCVRAAKKLDDGLSTQNVISVSWFNFQQPAWLFA